MNANKTMILILNPAKNAFEDVVFLHKTNFGWARIIRANGSKVSVPFEHLISK